MPQRLLLLHFHILWMLEWQKRHEVSVMHDVRLRRSLHQISFCRMRRNDVADGIGHSTLQRQRHSRKGMAQRLAALALPALAIRPDLIFKYFYNIRQDGARDH